MRNTACHFIESCVQVALFNKLLLIRDTVSKPLKVVFLTSYFSILEVKISWSTVSNALDKSTWKIPKIKWFSSKLLFIWSNSCYRRDCFPLNVYKRIFIFFSLAYLRSKVKQIWACNCLYPIHYFLWCDQWNI